MSAPKAYSTFSAALRADLEERFGDGEEFNTFDFYPLAERMGKPHKAVTHTLRDMCGKGLIEQTHELHNRHGGGPTKCYTIVPGAQIALKTPRDYQLEAVRRAHAQNLAAIRLHQIMDGITRQRLAAP